MGKGKKQGAFPQGGGEERGKEKGCVPGVLAPVPRKKETFRPSFSKENSVTKKSGNWKLP